MMTRAEISDYLARMRRWKTLPTDFDAKTEAIIRRFLRGGELVIDQPRRRGRAATRQEGTATWQSRKTRTKPT